MKTNKIRYTIQTEIYIYINGIGRFRFICLQIFLNNYIRILPAYQVLVAFLKQF